MRRRRTRPERRCLRTGMPSPAVRSGSGCSPTGRDPSSCSRARPPYRAPTGQQYADLPGNNHSNKSFTLPGSWSAAWHRAYTRSGGNSWDDTYRVSAGTVVRQITTSGSAADDSPANSPYGACSAFDTRHVTLVDPDGAAPVDVVRWNAGETAEVIESIPVEYYVGNDPRVTPGSGQYDPDQFDC